MQCNASVPTSVRFKQEAAELQAVVNRTGGGTLSAEQTLNVAAELVHHCSQMAKSEMELDERRGEEIFLLSVDSGAIPGQRVT